MEEVNLVIVDFEQNDKKEEMKWIIDVKDDVKIMEDKKNMEMKRREKRSIYKVPASVTNLNKKAYKPQAVSFGPYHHGEYHLKPMEDDKYTALLHFLKRSRKPLELFVESLSTVAQDLKDSYDCLDSKWKDNTSKFLKLMILDGCFMLEILRMWTESPQEDYAPYAPNDPTFSNHGKLYIMPYIRRDMLLLENQLPMLVLKKLVDVEGNHGKAKKYVNNLILKFWSLKEMKIGKCLHVLDVYRKGLLLEEPSCQSSPLHQGSSTLPAAASQEGTDEIIRSATELVEAGIKFHKSNTNSPRDISFNGGILYLPLIVVDDATESIFLNLMAFERFHVGAGNDVTSYIIFMDNIIDSSRDVVPLHNKGIIQNAIGSDKALASLFNSISKDITLNPASSLGVVGKNVNDYCKKPWNKYRANLIHTYFRSPWAILSVITAIFLFALTILQTIYTVSGYYHPHSN